MSKKQYFSRKNILEYHSFYKILQRAANQFIERSRFSRTQEDEEKKQSYISGKNNQMKEYFFIFMFASQLLGAQTPQKPSPISTPTSYNFDLQGHRGARGLAPENSLPAFQKALEIGVNTLELDVVITKDGQVVVSHEPWMNPSICLNAQGMALEKEPRHQYNIYKMTYEEVKTFDCGSLFYESFPEQELQNVHKPLLKEVLAMGNSVNKTQRKKVQYNIEIKSTPKGDGIFHPSPEVFTDLVMEILKQETNMEHVNLQSFDFRVLKYLHKKYPEVKLSALVDHPNFKTVVKELGFTPEIYSPHHQAVTQELVNEVHNAGTKIIPWTVNEPEMMLTLLKYGVDGIITDYPNQAIPFRKK